MEDTLHAFPIAVPGDHYFVHQGMTLRDWFATNAPPVPWNFEQPPYSDPRDIDDWSDEACRRRAQVEMERDLVREARWRFKYAEAMLIAREGGDA